MLPISIILIIVGLGLIVIFDREVARHIADNSLQGHAGSPTVLDLPPKPDWVTPLQWAIVSCLGSGLTGLITTIMGTPWYFCIMVMPLGILALIATMAKLSFFKEIKPREAAVMIYGRTPVWSEGTTIDPETEQIRERNGFWNQWVMVVFNVLTKGQSFTLKKSSVNEHFGEKDGLPFGVAHRSDDGASVKASLFYTVMTPFEMDIGQETQARVFRTLFQNLVKSAINYLEPEQASLLGSLFEQVLIRPGYYAVIVRAMRQGAAAVRAINAVQLVEINFNARASAQERQDIEEVIVPAMVTFLIAMAEELQTRVNKVDVGDVNFKDANLRLQFARWAAAERRRRADLAEAEGETALALAREAGRRAAIQALPAGAVAVLQQGGQGGGQNPVVVAPPRGGGGQGGGNPPPAQP